MGADTPGRIDIHPRSIVQLTSSPPAPPAELRPGGDRIDVRGLRVSAAITASVLAVALVVQGTLGVTLVAIQVAVFAVAVTFGVQRSPWAGVFRTIRRVADLGPAPATEDAAPPRFAQAGGLVVAGAGLAALLAGVTLAGWVLVGVVLGLSTLLATTGLCIGCELYVLGLRLQAAP